MVTAVYKQRVNGELKCLIFQWTFVLEDISPMGKKRALASASINVKKYASVCNTQQTFTIQLRPITKKIVAAEIELTISCVFLREGKAT